MYNIYDKTNITVQMEHEQVLHNKTKQKKMLLSSSMIVAK